MSTTNAILQKIDDHSLTLLIDGEVRQIKHQLEELKQLLQEKQVQTIQHAEKIYNIEQINEANFGFVVGKKAFNQDFTKQVLQAIRGYAENADQFLTGRERRRQTEWEKNKDRRNIAQLIIAESFAGVIGLQLRDLMAIGDEKWRMGFDKEYDYIEKSSFIVDQTLTLLNFVLLSRLWDRQKKSDQDLVVEEEKFLIDDRLNDDVPPTTAARLHLFRTLLHIFQREQIALPIAELDDFAPQLQAGSNFEQLMIYFEQTKDKLDQGQYNLINCYETEQQLAEFFKHFAFLAKYNMASIKRIGFRHIRHDDPTYLHDYIALGLDLNNNSENTRKGMHTQRTVNTNAVLFYEGTSYENSVNLFPFVIDFNALTLEQGAQIGFFQSRRSPVKNGILNYLMLNNAEIQPIKSSGAIEKASKDLGTYLLEESNRKKFNLDCVVKSFEEANQDLLNQLNNQNTFQYG